jgi:hypothetical protein
MRKLAIIPGLIFGLIFAGGGFFFLSQTAIPTWQSWQAMKSWQPAYAQLLSASGAENETRANYRYEFGGRTFQSSRVYVADFKDNIGNYHTDMIRLLRGYQQNGQPLPIWVNPNAPDQAVIDRDMRWGLFALMTAFCSVFIFIGLAVIYYSIRGADKQARVPQPSLEPDISNWQSHKGWESSKIASKARTGMWLFWVFAILWNAVSIPIAFIVPGELQGDNYAALVALLFPLVGIFLIYKSIAVTAEYRYFGKVLFEMDPFPGAIGGHVGGKIHVARLDQQQAVDAADLWVRLECVYSYISGSGKNRSRRESIKWVEQGKPKIERAHQGVLLSFRFEVPDNLPNADIEQKNAYHFWRLCIKADVSGIDLNRHYNIPVFATGETSRFVRHNISAESAALKERESDTAKVAIASGNFDIEGLAHAVDVDIQGSEIRLRFPMFRNKMLTAFAAIFAGGFGFASYSMASMAAKGGLFGIFITIFGLPFFLVALVAGIATIYLPFNNLRVTITPQNVKILRRLLFLPIFRRQFNRDEISHLDTKRSGSTGQGIKKIEHYKILLHDINGRKGTLAEGIDGEDIANHFSNYLAQRLGVESRGPSNNTAKHRLK